MEQLVLTLQHKRIGHRIEEDVQQVEFKTKTTIFFQECSTQANLWLKSNNSELYSAENITKAVPTKITSLKSMSERERENIPEHAITKNN